MPVVIIYVRDNDGLDQSEGSEDRSGQTPGSLKVELTGFTSGWMEGMKEKGIRLTPKTGLSKGLEV